MYKTAIYLSSGIFLKRRAYTRFRNTRVSITAVHCTYYYKMLYNHACAQIKNNRSDNQISPFSPGMVIFIKLADHLKKSLLLSEQFKKRDHIYNYDDDAASSFAITSILILGCRVFEHPFIKKLHLFQTAVLPNRSSTLLLQDNTALQPLKTCKTHTEYSRLILLFPV